MSYKVNVSNDITAYYSDSEDESLFYVKRRKVDPIPLKKTPINKRILKQNAPWTRREKELYVGFLKTHFDLMERSVEERREKKVYWLMGASIKSKNYAQCRIYHSRMLRRHGTIEKTIKGCEQELKRVQGALEKMQQYGLRVQLEEGEEQERRVQESELWTVLQSCQRCYYQNELDI